jgi:hypothetical protein
LAISAFFDKNREMDLLSNPAADLFATDPKFIMNSTENPLAATLETSKEVTLQKAPYHLPTATVVGNVAELTMGTMTERMDGDNSHLGYQASTSLHI